jgi:very-short-patch-repair endonuclease
MSAVEAGTTIADIVRRKLEQARHQLIERNLRNKLVNCALTSRRAQQVRIVDELADEVFKTLIVHKREMTFAPGRGLASEEEDGAEDPDYAVWIPPESSAPSAAEGGIASRHRDNILQTSLSAEGLQKRLTSLYYESIETEQEQGVNVLYLALGFVKWFEDPRSEVERFAPLVLVPVELIRKGARERFQLKVRDEDLYTNVSLKIWLSEQHSIEFPDLPESEDWLPSNYFESVRSAISRAPRWEVLQGEMLLGFFSFSKFLLWRDLDPANWPNLESLLGHGILRTILAPHEESGPPESPLIAEDARVDDHFKAADQVSILDTDSSQTIAIQTALNGRNLVVQGPPGTGKSQTIANIIAAAIHRGKSVLFVAEKLAALQVVYDRLRSVNLAPLCFELHSRRASKQQVLHQLREALNSASPEKVPDSLCATLDTVTASLWAHSDQLHRSHEPSGFTPYQIIGLICRLRDQGVPVPDFKVQDAEAFTRASIAAFLEEIRLGAQRLQLAGVPGRHPWRGCERDVMSPLDVQRLGDVSRKLSASVDALVVILGSVWPLVRAHELDDSYQLEFSDLTKIAKALSLAAVKPEEPVEALCHPRWDTDLEPLERAVDCARRLTELERALQPLFTEAAWTRDWTQERAEIAGSGQSLLRFLRGPYRAALRTYRGACREKLPDSHHNRLAALDQLIAAQELRAQLAELGRALATDLPALWPELPASWPRLAKLAGWLRAAAEVSPRLCVRNQRLLTWSEPPARWSERLTNVARQIATHFKQLASLVQLLGADSEQEPGHMPMKLGDLFERVQGWRMNPERFNEWPPARDFLTRLLASTGASFHQQVYAGQVLPAELVDRANLALSEQIWNQMCRSDSALARIDGRLLDELVSKFRGLDASRVRAAASEVARRHFDQKPTGNVGEMAVVRQEINKSRKFLPVRKLLDLAGNAIQTLKPVFLMSPLSIAQYLAPGRLQFDLLLIDEASQVRPEDALGAVARAKQIVVVGDTKQLPPTNFFNRLVMAGDGEDGDEAASDGTPVIGAMESILSLCDATLSNRTMLRWHYRSHHPALIAVSNRSFYEDKLLLPPSVGIGQVADGLGIVFHRMPSGGYDRGRSATNTVEADRVAEAACAFARAHPDKTLGVGTFSVAQRDVIRDRIDQRRREDPALEPFFATNQPNPFFVKNLESIQGDERDVIFISVGYGRDAEGHLTRNFGPINNDGGERRLNVLITRAKERLEVFSSLTGDDIDVSSRKPGVVALKQFLQFAEKGYLDVPERTDKTFDSDFEESVANFLRQRDYKVHPQVGMAGFYIDLGVLHPTSPTRYVLGIECDGATYHSSRSARDRDRIRQQILESRGWSIHRIWSTDWFNRRTAEEHRLLDALHRAESAPKSTAAGRPAAAPGTGANPTPSVRAIPTPRRVLYEEANFQVTSELAPHEAPKKVQEAVFRIVEIEGPIHHEEVGRRLASVWGLDRAGSRIQDAARRALKALEREAQLQSSGAFWMNARAAPLKTRDRSEAQSNTLRKAEYLPPAEVAVAAAEVVKDNVRVPLDDLVIEVARRLGFQRTGQDLQDIILKVIQSEIGTRFEAHEDGSVMLMCGQSL